MPLPIALCLGRPSTAHSLCTLNVSCNSVEPLRRTSIVWYRSSSRSSGGSAAPTASRCCICLNVAVSGTATAVPAGWRA
ncbi:hypothetical protein PF002_g32623 [Phytophthora fragariae]|uniref:Uncharacterized protein n=1 Tax=Phytophthora fragariae TaxID=53985 RepID=A0A6A3GE65_9STRA|nr:hypothetical protein PF003_g40739 [Phytophthora fragariae]KAE8917177.1 hypothetical protein PF009_g32501 [Phytophthora fragariae]KAE8955632.1 hypothetical protein PF011_g31736 [Phytophthora fragariae]KAE9056132.1 hypothetical protein PF007_g32089 [Phytophthora fragariae]KAE9160417.1 hypothetical protein PF002_g32623 [Phytophthora fragariae]